MSRFAAPKSEEARLDALAGSVGGGDLDENDPASVARFMKRMGREFGEDLGDDFGEAVDEAMGESADDAGTEGMSGDAESDPSASGVDS